MKLIFSLNQITFEFPSYGKEAKRNNYKEHTQSSLLIKISIYKPYKMTSRGKRLKIGRSLFVLFLFVSRKLNEWGMKKQKRYETTAN